MARDGKHFCNHRDTLCHPKSGYVTNKLRGTSTCRGNNNAILSNKVIFTFSAVSVSDICAKRNRHSIEHGSYRVIGVLVVRQECNRH